jgi:hypothetical protein
MDYAATLKYYANLLIKQYYVKPKANDTIKNFVSCMIGDGLPFELLPSFDLETAEGAQLDILGRIVGVLRNVYGLDLAHTFFSFSTYPTSPASVGFARYATPDTGNFPLFARYTDNAKYTMTDTEFRILIKLKIFLNNSFASLKAIVGKMWELFGDQLQVVDNLDMTITYNLSAGITNALKAAVFLGYLPRPMAVEAIVNYL